MNYIYILNKHGRPLMPTVRYGHIKRLIKDGKAVVINNKPFTVRLKYETNDIVQRITLGIDTGRENIGLAVISNKNCYARINFYTNNKSVTKNMQERKQFRSERRRHRRIRNQRRSIKNNNQFKSGNSNILCSKKKCLSRKIFYPGMKEGINCKVCKGKEAKFNNRKRQDGWLTPSARQLIQMYINAVKLISSFLPISKISIERVNFDFQKLANENIENWQYSKGPLYGFDSYKDYIDELQDYKCLLCSEKITQYHHIVPKSKGGSNVASNFAGLCNKCHELVHTDDTYTSELLTLKNGCYKIKISLLSSCMDKIVEELDKLYSIQITTGYETSIKRKKLGLEKDHCNDAICIALDYNQIENFDLDLPDILILKRFKKKSNNNINKYGRREYFYNGKLVAVNRSKSFEQKEDSLFEYMQSYSKLHNKLECDRHFHELKIVPTKRIYTFHKENVVPKFKCGDKFKYEKHNKIKGNIKTGIFICEGIKINENKLCHNGTKNKNIKHCKLLNHNSLQFI